MAQTRRKRRTKHRGNALGVIEARGRTSKPSETARKNDRAGARASGGRAGGRSGTTPRPHRLDKPPTWIGAIKRAALFAGLYLVILVVIPSLTGSKHVNVASSAFVAVVAFLVFVPATYYTDLYGHRRRMQRLRDGPPRKG